MPQRGGSVWSLVEAETGHECRSGGGPSMGRWVGGSRADCLRITASEAGITRGHGIATNPVAISLAP